MDDLLGGLVLFVGGALLAVVVLWVVLAALMRLLALLVVYWIATFLAGIAIGVIWGLTIPVRVLSGKATVRPQIATPADVVAKKVIKFEPRGEAKNFGWDLAWPVYNPYQAKNDAAAVVSETKTLISLIWSRVSPARWDKSAKPSTTSSPTVGKKKKNGRVAKVTKVIASAPGFAWIVIAFAPVAGFVAGVWISIIVWRLVMAVIGGLVYVGQQGWVLGHRSNDKFARKRDGAKLNCNVCYYEGTLPSYKCSNPGCSVIHRDVSPGPLGVVHRRCECGTGFPTTVRSAAKHLTAVCPRCGTELIGGAGTRRTVQLPTIGAVAAGKTRLLASAAVAMESALDGQGGAFTSMNADAQGFLSLSQALLASGQSTAKTAAGTTPAGLPFLVERDKTKLELHFVDASGESFRNMDSTQELGYLDTARVFVFVVDPLGLPGVLEEAKRAGIDGRVEIATSDQEDAYASAVDRLRQESVNFRGKHLAVVLTKMDILRTLPGGSGLTGAASDVLRRWLIDQDQDGLVRRVEDDFSDNVQFFGVDLLQPLPFSDPMSPIHLFQWVLDKSQVKMTIDPTVTTTPATPVVTPVSKEPV